MSNAGAPSSRSNQEIATKNLETAYKEKFDEKELSGEKEKLDMAVDAVQNLLKNPDADIVLKTKISLSDELSKLSIEDQGKILGLLDLSLIDQVEIGNMIDGGVTINVESEADLRQRIGSGGKLEDLVTRGDREVYIEERKSERVADKQRESFEKEASIYFAYFGVAKEDYKNLLTAQERISKSGLDFSIKNTLGKYKDFIETELSGIESSGNLSKNIKDFIKGKIEQASKKIGKDDEEMNRFVLNSELTRAFDFDDIRDILTSVKYYENYSKNTQFVEDFVLQKYGTQEEWDRKCDDEFSTEKSRIQSEYTDPRTGKLSESAGTIIMRLYNTNERKKSAPEKEWSQRKKDFAEIQKQWVDGSGEKINPNIRKRVSSLATSQSMEINYEQISEVSFLSEENQATEGKAMLWYLATIVPQLIPGVGDVLSVGFDGPDIFTKEHTTLKYLKKLPGNLIPQDYQLEKHWYDHSLAGVGVLGSAFSLNEFSKIPRIAMLASKLSKIPIDVLAKIAKTNPKLGKALDLFKAFSKTNGAEAKKFEKTVNAQIGKTDEVKKSKKIDRTRETVKTTKNTDVVKTNSKTAREIKCTEYIHGVDTQKEISKIFDGCDDIPIEVRKSLTDHINKNALLQEIHNPEQYVGHGFGHSLNVKKQVESILNTNPQIVKALSDKYSISPEKSRMLSQLVAIYHDFGYPKVPTDKEGKALGKALHAITGAEILKQDEFIKIFDKCFPEVTGNVRKTMLSDLTDGVLFHSADKVEISRNTKIKIAHGTFIIDKNNIVNVYNKFGGMHKEGEILIEASAKHIADMKDILKQQGVAHSNFKFVEGGKDSYSGRKADLLVKGDAGLGVEYKAADALDDPLLFLVRLADNTDITINRFSDLQKTKCFQSFYHILGEGPSGKLCNYLENIGKEKNGVEKAIKFIDDDPKLKSICGHLNIDFRNTKSTKDLLKNIKKGFIEETLSDTRYAKEVKTFGIDKMRKILGDQDSIALRHFGGCESVKNVELINGRLVVKVDVKQFNQLNKTKVTEKIKDSSGAFNNVSVGVGEYQIFRFMDANNSLVNNGKKVVIQVEDVGTGKILTSNFAQAFRKRIIN